MDVEFCHRGGAFARLPEGILAQKGGKVVRVVLVPPRTTDQSDDQTSEGSDRDV